MEIIFVRHGETAWNAVRRYQGYAPIPLNERGKQQAHLTGKRLQHTAISGYYASDIVRAWETATIISEYIGKEAQPLIGMREVDVGGWEGYTAAELAEKYPDHMREHEQDPAHTTRMGGESYAQLQARAWTALMEIHQAHAANDVLLVVCHGGTIRSIVCRILNLDLKNFGRMWVDNGSLTIVRHSTNRGWRLYRLNDSSHLEEGLLREEGGE